MITGSEIDNLVLLFDDRDNVVKEAVAKRLREAGLDALDVLSAMIAAENSDSKRERYLAFKEFLIHETVISEFKKMLIKPEFSLEDGLSALSVITEEASHGRFRNHIDSEVYEIISEISDDRTDVENMEIFNYIFFNRLRYSFTHPSLNEIRFINVGDVVFNKLGNPLVVSVIYFLYASKAGIPVYPLAFRGGFIPVYLNKKGDVLFYPNIYKNGEIFLENSLKKFFSDAGFEIDESTLKIKGDKYLTAIFVEVLKHYYASKGNLRCEALLGEISVLLDEEEFI